MTAIYNKLAARPGSGDDPTEKSTYRKVGLALALIGMMGAVASVIGNFVAAGGIDEQNSFAETRAWTFGLSIFSFGVVKVSISIILMGIVVRLWFRVDAIKSALKQLHGHSDRAAPALGPVETEWGDAEVTNGPAELLFIHKMARTMWRPMLVMGAMFLTAGLAISVIWADKTPGSYNFREAAAYTQGAEFLGEALLLSGIAFLLGTIMAGLREGGGEVQSSLGIPVTTLKMPLTAKAFVALMMMGMMIGMLQFVGYVIAAGFAKNPASFSTWLNVLGPLRELSLGLILAGIVLALVTIGNVLAFQFDRVKSIIRSGY